MEDDKRVIGITGLVVYGSMGIFMFTSFLWSLCFAKKEGVFGSLAMNVRRIFRFYLFAFVAVRIAWIILHSFNGEEDVITFTLNRFAITTYITAFTLIMFYWAELFHKNYYDSKRFLPQLGWVFVIINIALYIYQIVIIALFASGDQSREGNPVYETNIITDVVLSAVLSLGFFVYGWLLFFVTKNSEEGGESREKELLKILLITLVFSACFLGRAFMFLYRPITDEYLPEVVFYTFAYFVPESVPCVFQVYLAETTKGKQERDTKFIDDLYAASDDSIEDYREYNAVLRASSSEDTYLLNK